MPIRKAKEPFHATEWYVRCPYCHASVDFDTNPPEEGELIECDDCHKKFKSIGWEV